MRVNIYAEEMTTRVELIEKEVEGTKFTGIRFYLYLPACEDLGEGRGVVQYRGPFLHRPGDDDSAAVTFWGKTQLKIALKKALELLEKHE